MDEPPFISLPIYNAAIAPAPSPTAPRTFRDINNSPTGGAGAVVDGGPKRNNNQQLPLTVPAGCMCFRLLCHASRIGGVIGKSGTIIKQLQQDTSAKIRIEDPPPGSHDSVITIIANSSVNKTLSYDYDNHEHNYNYVESSEYCEVSDAQEALIRVYERVLSVAADVDGVYLAPGGIVSCRLLANTSLIGYVIGTGGKVIEKIKKDTGCRIRILGQDKLLSCAMPNDNLIEIEGDVMAIKKALVAVTRRLQDFPSSDKPRMDLGSRHPVSLDKNTVPFIDSRNSQQEIVFRILCSSNRVGGVIGNSGTIIQALENESGASIYVGGPVSDCDEQLITIAAMESLESDNSPAQHAVILVFNKSVEAGFEKGLDSSSVITPISARLLITRNQIGCLLGLGGSIVADMRKETGAVIKIVGGHHVPRCALETDQVVLMTGEFVNVQDALYSVTGRLRNHQFSSRMPNAPKTEGTHARGNDRIHPRFHTSVATSHQFNQHTTLDQRMDNLRLSSNARYAVVANTTVDIIVPENVIGSVYGENGSILNSIRQISGANIMMHEPLSGTTHYIMVISGSPDEALRAQSLLQAFILAAQ